MAKTLETALFKVKLFKKWLNDSIKMKIIKNALNF